MTGDERDGDADVSFVVPARNEAEYLRGTLASLTALDTAYAYEVLVVDGDSSDATREIAREYDATIVPEGGESIATARNLGAERASGEWLAFVDADTRVRANYLTELLGFVERRLEIVDAGDVAIDVRRRRLGFVGNQFVSRRSVFAWLFAHVGDDDVGPVVGERPRDRSSDSARFTGHDGRLFRE